MPLLHTLIHRLDSDGVRSLLLKVFRTVRARLQRRPAATARPGGAMGFVHPFDREHGVDTSGFIPGEALVEGPIKAGSSDFYTTAYYAVAPSTLRQALAYLPIPAEVLPGFTFVDLGCGKGRALLVAAELGFGGLMGVELSAALCAVARENTERDERIRIAQQDAVLVDYPQTGLVIFLYHPFLAPVLRKVLANLEGQCGQKPRPIFLLYANPSYANVLAKYTFLKQVWDYGFDLSAEDAAADRHGMTRDHYTLYQGTQRREMN